MLFSIPYLADIQLVAETDSRRQEVLAIQAVFHPLPGRDGIAHRQVGNLKSQAAYAKICLHFLVLLVIFRHGIELQQLMHQPVHTARSLLFLPQSTVFLDNFYYINKEGHPIPFPEPFLQEDLGALPQMLQGLRIPGQPVPPVICQIKITAAPRLKGWETEIPLIPLQVLCNFPKPPLRAFLPLGEQAKEVAAVHPQHIFQDCGILPRILPGAYHPLP